MAIKTAYLCTPDSVTPIEGAFHKILYKGDTLNPTELGERLGLTKANIQKRVRHYATGHFTYDDVVF